MSAILFVIAIPIVIFIIYVLASELANYEVYKWFMTEEDEAYIKSTDWENWRLNRYNHGIIMVNDDEIISNICGALQLFHKWHYAKNNRNLFRIPRWSKLHKELNKKHKEMLKEVGSR